MTINGFTTVDDAPSTMCAQRNPSANDPGDASTSRDPANTSGGVDMAQTSTCSIEGCELAPISRQMCRKHYQQAWKQGFSRRPSLTERLLGKIVIEDDSGCWVWQGSTNGGGYGLIGVDYHTRRTHRVAYELFVGPIPDGLQIDHLCRVRACCNPSHLEPVTPIENIHRSVTHNAAKTHCPLGHAYDETNTYMEPRGGRVCRACRRLQAHEAKGRNNSTPRAVDTWQPGDDIFAPILDDPTNQETNQ